MLSSNTVVVASLEKTSTKKKNSIELLEKGKILPLYDYFDQKCRRADKIGTF